MSDHPTDYELVTAVACLVVMKAAMHASVPLTPVPTPAEGEAAAALVTSAPRVLGAACELTAWIATGRQRAILAQLGPDSFAGLLALRDGVQVDPPDSPQLDAARVLCAASNDDHDQVRALLLTAIQRDTTGVRSVELLEVAP